MAVHTGCVNVHIKALYNVHKTISPITVIFTKVCPSVFFELKTPPNSKVSFS